jgi:hypothetical protein
MRIHLFALQSLSYQRLMLPLSCVLLFLSSACSLTPGAENVTPLSADVTQPTSTTSNEPPSFKYWDEVFYFADGNYPNQADQPWHQAPDWMYGQGGPIPKPKPEDMTGYTPPPPINSPVWSGAFISAPLPGEDGDPSHSPTLVSYFNYSDLGSLLYIYGLEVYVTGDLPPSGNGDYRQFRLLKVEPVNAPSPYVKYLITYSVDVLGSGPGGPLVDIEQHTALATYDFTIHGGSYQ